MFFWKLAAYSSEAIIFAPTRPTETITPDKDAPNVGTAAETPVIAEEIATASATICET